MIVYYSPFGGMVRACILPGRGAEGGAVAPQPDPRLELEVLQGLLRRTDVTDDHPLAQHILDAQQPTQLDGWFVFGERLRHRSEA